MTEGDGPVSAPEEWERRSSYTGPLPTGCRLCARGSKLVLLVTGMCGSSCPYCPLSEAKRGRDVMYANERPVSTPEEVLEEARLMDAEGTGVTGGDPALVLERTAGFIRALKEAFGRDHHVHLYTSVPLARGGLETLRSAGLDEVRFHPPLEALAVLGDTDFPRALAEAVALGLEAGYEVPVLPDRGDDLRAFLRALLGAEGAPFANLNELEFSETNAEELRSRGYGVRDDISAAVAGSEELARALVGEMAPTGLRVHYCSASFKDAVQLRRRLERRARNVARPHELVTDDQTLLKAVVEVEDPGGLARDLSARFDVPPELMVVDSEGGLLELAAWVAEELVDEIRGDTYLVEEYPTWDRLEVERVPMRQLRGRRRQRRSE